MTPLNMRILSYGVCNSIDSPRKVRTSHSRGGLRNEKVGGSIHLSGTMFPQRKIGILADFSLVVFPRFSRVMRMCLCQICTNYLQGTEEANVLRTSVAS